MKGMDEVLTTQEACKFLKISRPTILSYFYSGKIAAEKIGKGWRVYKGEMIRFILGQKGHFKVGDNVVKEKRAGNLAHMIAQKVKQLGPETVAKIQAGDAWVKISVIENGFTILEVE